jgi:ABC-2 type transport system permease protein
MVADIGTVVWKEWREVLSWGGSRGKVMLLLFAGVFGVFLPLQMGRTWIESPVVLVYWAWVPMFLVISVISDSFAGERERHTLETLLASRLSDRAILFGKVAAAVGYGLGITWVSLLLGLVTVNLAHGHGKPLFYSTTVGLGIVALSLLCAGLAAGAGVLVSLRAATVRQAQQTVSIAVMVLLFVPIFGVRVLPAEWKAHLAGTLTVLGVARIVVIAVVALTVLDVGLFAGAIAKFRRAQLIID